jgi:phytanoyl-CoA hydroxylase
MTSINPQRPGSLYRIPDFDGNEVEVPVDSADDFAYFRLGQAEETSAYYRENGYVVVRDLMPRDLCDRAVASFDAEVKPFGGFIYRQASANPERHVFTEHGFMLNTILNIQSLDRRYFSGFRGVGLELLTHENMRLAVRTLLGEAGKLVQSMYFDGNPETWPHQDTYYLDAEEVSRRVRGGSSFIRKAISSTWRRTAAISTLPFITSATNN